MILFSHPTGSTMSKQSLQAIKSEGLLKAYSTTVGFLQDSFLNTLPLPKKFRDLLSRRSYTLSKKELRTHFFPETWRLLSQKLHLHSLIRHEKGVVCTDRIFRNHDYHTANYLKKHHSSIHAVYGYEDSCLQTFLKAKSYGLRCIYELPIAYWECSQKILQEEAIRYPLWEPTLLGNRDSFSKNIRKTQEIALADLIICPSSFVKNSIPEKILKQTPCAVIPYGSPYIESIEKTQNSSVFRLLFVGSLSQRKGLADVFSALKILNRKDIDFIVLGQALMPLSFYRKEYSNFIYEPPCSNKQILDIMRTCDAFILPSLVEGRAIVQLEALSCGLPLIITPHTGGEDLIDEGSTGFSVPIRSPEKIAEKIAFLADNKHLLPSMRVACQQKAKEKSWSFFREKLLSTLLEYGLCKK